VTAVQAAGLVDTLKGEGPFTVFAPTNEAFAAVEGLDEILNNTETLTAILTYHVIPSAIPSSDLLTSLQSAPEGEGISAATVQGANVTATLEGEAIAINEAKVVIPDVEASNGIVHVIDTVLLPPETRRKLQAGSSCYGTSTAAMSAPSMSSGGAAAPAPAQEGSVGADLPPSAPAADAPAAEAEQDIVEIATGTENLSTLVTALQAANLVDTLKGDGPFTVFAPTNEAFAAVEGIDEIVADTEVLTKILTYHVVPAELPSEAIAAQIESATEGSITASTVEGQNVTASAEGANLLLNGQARVVTPDVKASNGIVHIINNVLIPPELRRRLGPKYPGKTGGVAGEPKKDIVETAMATEALSTLVAAVKAAELVETLKSEGPFTVFAPTNEAFAALPAGVLDQLLCTPANVAILKNILLFHVVAGKAIDSKSIIDAAPLAATTALEEDVNVKVENGTVLVNDIPVIKADVKAKNGIVHVISGVLLPASFDPAALEACPTERRSLRARAVVM